MNWKIFQNLLKCKEFRPNSSRVITHKPSAVKTHPTIDCVFLNAGTQHIFDFSNPESVDLSVFNRETTVNFSSFVALTHALLPHLLARKERSSLIYTGTQVSLVPVFALPAYSASKAALDAFVTCLREQLRETNVRVMDISPGPIQTEMSGNFGLPITEFVDQAYIGLAEGRADTFPGCIGGSTKEQFIEIVEKRGAAFARMTALMKSLS